MEFRRLAGRAEQATECDGLSVSFGKGPPQSGQPGTQSADPIDNSLASLVSGEKSGYRFVLGNDTGYTITAAPITGLNLPGRRAQNYGDRRPHYRFSSIILGIVNNAPFQMRVKQEAKPWPSCPRPWDRRSVFVACLLWRPEC
jgi:hypothetical protein